MTDNAIAEPDRNDNQISSSSGEHITIDQLQQELNEALSQAEENLSGWKRTQADLENFRKRTETESSEWISFGKQAAFVQILPVLDSFQQAVLYSPNLDDEQYKNWKVGLEGIVKQIDTVTTQMGVEKIETLGKRFDPNYHEAVREVPGETDGIIVEQYQTGYMVGGKVIRPAQVAISKKNM